MTTIAVLQRRTNNLAQRRLQTGADHARADAPSRRLSIPATDTLNNSLDHQSELWLPTSCVTDRLEGYGVPRSHLPHQPNPHRGARHSPRPFPRGFFPWRLSDAGHWCMSRRWRWPASETLHTTRTYRSVLLGVRGWRETAKTGPSEKNSQKNAGPIGQVSP